MPSPVPALAPVRLPGLLRGTATCCMRTFCSTRPTLALGPQSPDYIHIPKPLQPTFPAKLKVKGHLPVPRDVFKVRTAHPKESPISLSESTRAPVNLKTPGPYSKDADYRLYKQRLSEKRRAALRQGVKELHERKVASDARYIADVEKSGAIRRTLALAPPRQVDVLTQTSIPKSLRDFLGNTVSSSPRGAFTSARRKAYTRRVAKVQAKRSSRLHELYTNARTFIVDTEQLDEAIEKAFGTEESPMAWDTAGNMGPRNDSRQGLSPWQGPIPEGVSDMLQKLRGGEGVGLAKERVRRVAEELTGGKM